MRSSKLDHLLIVVEIEATCNAADNMYTCVAVIDGNLYVCELCHSYQFGIGVGIKPLLSLCWIRVGFILLVDM